MRQFHKPIFLCAILLVFFASACTNKTRTSEGQSQTPIAAVQNLSNLSHAEQLIMAQRYKEAIEIISHVIESEGQSAYALSLRGVSWAKLNKPHYAFADLIEATRIDYNADTLVNIGNAERMFGYCERAADAYKKALILQPNDFEILVNLGSAYACYGETDLSLAALEKAKLIKHDDEILWTNYAISYILQEKYAEAQKAVDMAISINPIYWPIYKAALKVCDYSNDPNCRSKAKDNYEKYKPKHIRSLR